MKYRTKFLNYPVDNICLSEFIDFVNNSIQKNEKHFIAVQNANKMYLSNKYPEVSKAINEASIILPENAINIGMKLLGRPLKQRNMGGIMMMIELLKLSDKFGYSVYFLGTTSENLNILVKKVREDYPNLKISGYRDGYFPSSEEFNIAKSVGESEPNILFLALGSPKQELLISKYFREFNSNIILGVGGSFNVIAGLEKPAPGWTKYGFEWLYRSFQDMSKFKRYLIINSFFIYSILKFLITKK